MYSIHDKYFRTTISIESVALLWPIVWYSRTHGEDLYTSARQLQYPSQTDINQRKPHYIAFTRPIPWTVNSPASRQVNWRREATFGSEVWSGEYGAARINAVTEHMWSSRALSFVNRRKPDAIQINFEYIPLLSSNFIWEPISLVESDFMQTES